jgi:hypothetical protein
MVHVPEFQPNPSQNLFVSEKTVQQLLPVSYLTMFEYQFQGDVFKEQILGSTEHGGEALLLLFGHGKKGNLKKTVYRLAPNR